MHVRLRSPRSLSETRSIAFLSLHSVSALRHHCGELLPGRDDRLDDPGIAGASADLSAQLMTDGLRIGAGQALEDVTRRDQHAGRTEAALQAVALVKVLAQDLHNRIVAKPF